MRTYRLCWLVAAGATLGLSVAAGLSTLTWQSVLALVVPLAGLGALYGFLWAPFLPGVRHPSRDGAVLGAATGPALVGLFGLLGPVAALVLAGVALAHPATVPWLCGRRSAPPRRDDVATPAAPAPAPHGGRVDVGSDPATVRAALRAASDEELRHAWQTTNDSLGFSRSPDRAVQLAEVRSLVLDEFEARDPAAFRVWLWAAPRPSAGPALHRRTRHSSGR